MAAFLFGAGSAKEQAKGTRKEMTKVMLAVAIGLSSFDDVEVEYRKPNKSYI